MTMQEQIYINVVQMFLNEQYKLMMSHLESGYKVDLDEPLRYCLHIARTATIVYDRENSQIYQANGQTLQ